MTSTALSSSQLVEPELHVVGEVCGASLRCMSGGFGGGWGTALLLSWGGRGDNAFAGWEVKKGKDWKCVGGREMGQTQVDYPEVNSGTARTQHAASLCCTHDPPASFRSSLPLRLLSALYIA